MTPSPAESECTIRRRFFQAEEINQVIPPIIGLSAVIEVEIISSPGCVCTCRALTVYPRVLDGNLESVSTRMSTASLLKSHAMATDVQSCLYPFMFMVLTVRSPTVRPGVSSSLLSFIYSSVRSSRLEGFWGGGVSETLPVLFEGVDAWEVAW